jgi:hypothetical protein
MKAVRETVDLVINSLVERFKNELKSNIESIFIAGSYATGTISNQCPNVNLYIISKPNKSNELFFPLSKIFYEIKNNFKDKINIVADLKPYRFAYYKPVKDKITLTIRLNIFDMRDGDKKFMVPDYVLRGWLNSEKVLYGQDVLKDLPIKVEVSPEIINQKRFVLLTIMQQLKHIPFTYDWSKEPELLFHESYEFSKYLLSEGLLLKMKKSEIEASLDVKIYEKKEKFVDFYLEKYGPEAAELAKAVFEAREHYLEWKDDVAKAKQMYSTAWRIYGIVWKAFLETNVGAKI